MNDQTKNGSEELKYLSSDKSLKPQKSWEEIFTELSSNPTNDFFSEGREDSPPQERHWKLFK
ncbi:hypothetical protein [Rickettsia conorii]|uniref:hypothetical protein n=1 Tax=Rickettsia conorii TaxID=781 RepID=UPI0022608389|nr:hypothetical protein [Rickettsia conorii]UZW38834.1 hypothetical protein OSR38_00790 [Rickettsia conorii subsp. heilongjiangensis]